MKKWLWIVLIILVLLVAIVIGGVIIIRKNKSKGPDSLAQGGNLSAEQMGKELSGGHCSGKGPGKLTHSAMDPADFSTIIPYGLMIGGHVTPIDHQYYAPKSYSSPRDAYPVYAMGDARLVAIEHRTQQPQDNQGTRAVATNEYRLIFSQTCTFLYYYDLLTSLTPELTKLVGDKQYASVDVPVKAGDKIGAIGGQTLDFAVWDTEKPLSGFIIPAHYQAERWKVYTADPLDYESADLKSLMLSRSPRVDEPISGKLDWDVDGTLQGNWFLQGTNGIEGKRGDPKGEWVSHLAFAPDLYDPSRWIVSMGDYPIAQDANTQVSATQFYAKLGSPDPTKVTPESSLTKVELVHEEYVKPDGSSWRVEDGFVKGPKVGTQKEDQIQAVALVELTGPRTLKFEVFPGKTAAEVSGFDGKEQTYER